MSAPSLSSEAAAAGNYPSERFNQRERKLLQSVSEFMGYRIFAAGEFTTVGGDSSESISVSGALASDLAFVFLKVPGAAPRAVSYAAAAAGAINVEMSGDPSNDHELVYALLRAI